MNFEVEGLYGLLADRACDDATRSVRDHVAGIFTKLPSNHVANDVDSESRGRHSHLNRLRDALNNINAQRHLRQLQAEVFRRCLAAEEDAFQQLTAKRNEIIASMNTVDHKRLCPVRLPDELVLNILSLVHEAEGGHGDTTLQKLLRLPGLSEGWRYALQTLTTHQVRESFGLYSETSKEPGGRDVKLYDALKVSAPAKLDLSFFSCNIDSVHTALEFSDRWSAAHFRSSYSGPAVVDALNASKEALLNVRHLGVELVEYRERPGGLILPDNSWALFSEHEPIRPRLRSARIFLPFLSGLSALLKNVEDLEILLPANFTDWDAANRTLASLPALTRLVISPCKIYHKRHVDLFSDEDLEAIASTGPIHLAKLESLQINFDSRIAAAIVAFVRCPSLKQLYLNTCEIEFARGRLDSGPSLSLLESASQEYPRLEMLSIQKTDERIIRALAKPDERGRWLYPSLTSLDLPTPSPALISLLLDFVRARMSDQGIVPIRQLKISNPGPLDKTCRLEMSSLSLLVPDLIAKRKEVNAVNPDAQGQSYCRVQ